MTSDELKKAFDKFKNDWSGKPLMVLPSSKKYNHGQCFDLAAKWANTLGVPNYPGNPSPFPYSSAYQIYTEFGDFQAKYFDRIPNTPDYIVRKGDLVIWDPRLNGGDGHVALGDEYADLNYFISFDENWEYNNWHPQEVWHDYDTGPVLGCLRFKTTVPAVITDAQRVAHTKDVIYSLKSDSSKVKELQDYFHQ